MVLSISNESGLSRGEIGWQKRGKTLRKNPEAIPLGELKSILDQLDSEVPAGKATYIPLLKMCSSARELAEAKRLHSHIARSQYGSSTFLCNLVLQMYGKCGWAEGAAAVFASIRDRDAFSWSMMIAAFAENGQLKNAIATFEEMPRKDVVAQTAMIVAHARLGKIEDAKMVFEEMTQRDVVAWTAMITAYAQQGYCMQAYFTYQRMDLEGMRPTAATFISALEACSGMTSVSKGKIIHENVVECGFLHWVKVTTALVTMYGKCGSLAAASCVFWTARNKNVCTWSALVAAHAQNGRFLEAIFLFECLEQEGLVPDGITYISVIYACSQAGLLTKGLDYFASMSADYGVEPAYGHYECMVDLLARAGKLEDAERLIQAAIPSTGLVLAWRALLGGCKIHGDVNRASQAAELLLRLDPGNPSPYLILANMYTAAGRHDLAADVEKAFKGKGVLRSVDYRPPPNVD